MKTGFDYVPSDTEKSEIVTECVENFNTYLNRWPEPRVAEGAVVEWQGEGCLLRDIYGREFIDCLGGFGIFCRFNPSKGAERSCQHDTHRQRVSAGNR